MIPECCQASSLVLAVPFFESRTLDACICVLHTTTTSTLCVVADNTEMLSCKFAYTSQLNPSLNLPQNPFLLGHWGNSDTLIFCRSEVVF